MTHLFRAVFLIFFIFFLYHTLRDTLQIAGMNNLFTNILHRDHIWCKATCDYVTYPLNFIGSAGAFSVLRRNYIGKLGLLTLSTGPLLVIATILP